ncbi:hypothetical protein PXD04_04485 [Methanosphaera sp. ISO3-F5]|uniref:hypothetical protein n=1 Tax=Methanosphaera sp. ISO3-F5 TaxID=1452353 RepID=UPI002B2636AA|nr:hypothetical protein [Methanosphaera sp. ISO3-F5]WQH65041.1 hypothetical protein PXD04_04485 [Methanosphaera sp. ISO3-F5]
MKSRINSIIKNFNNTINGTSVHNLSSKESSGDTRKIYQIDEAGDYIETTYKGITVYIRENYPYYNPQNDKVYYSKEEEAEDLYKIAEEMNKSSLETLNDL